jgi:transposase
MIVVGQDVHVRNSFFHATDDAGRRLGAGRYGNTPAELTAFFAGLLERVGGEVQPLRVVLESTTNARAMVGLVRQAATPLASVLTVDVLNPRKLRLIAESVCKCDAVDARVLNELARANLKLPTCYVPDDEVFALREHLRARADQVRLRTMLKNRVHAVLHRRGLLTPPSGLFTKDGRAFLAQLPLDEAGRTIVDRFGALITTLDAALADSERELRTLSRLPRWAPPAARLQTMPGVGLLTALTILAELGELTRFRNRSAVSNYAGLVPVLRESNQKHYSGGITHHGSAHLRAMLVEAAWTARSRVPAYAALFERVSQRRGKQVAIVALARRILEDAFVMLKKGEPFRYVLPADPVAWASAAPPAAGPTPRVDRTVASSAQAETCLA